MGAPDNGDDAAASLLSSLNAIMGDASEPYASMMATCSRGDLTSGTNIAGGASMPGDDPDDPDDIMNGPIGEASIRFAAPTAGARDTSGLKKDVSDVFHVDLVASAAAEVASG